ncbi:MAG: deoxyribodipyrimidine photo-lyase [Candidatus Melainabacteria bacterium]|nr:deoxyribodipyrimidine photo-lyase [Candidatus Melainabacteria bacterium]
MTMVSSTQAPTLLWLRQCLRLSDNPALEAALNRGGPVIPIFIWNPEAEGEWAPGGATRWWLHQSLASLMADLTSVGSQLILRHGDAATVLSGLVAETGATAVLTDRRYEPSARRQGQAVQSHLHSLGVPVVPVGCNVLFEPGQVLNRAGEPYRVFSQFWKTIQREHQPSPPLPKPAKLAAPAQWPQSLPLAALKLEPTIDWAGGLRQTWQVGEAAGHRLLNQFCEQTMGTYQTTRNLPDRLGTSRMSPYLHFGEISPRQIWYAVAERLPLLSKEAKASAECYLREIAWREFAHQLLYFFPHTANRPLRPEFEAFPWKTDPEALSTWQQGKTGYPIVDAGMRELWQTGWMHNRVRMIVASFLVKDLLQPWQEGARWFWDTLVDADLANNTLGWQWTAGCGADAAPYFRVFNPVLQGEKFDPNGIYVRRWVPELASLTNAQIHRPWEIPPLTAHSLGVRLGNTYPSPMVDHFQARDAALAAFAEIKQSVAHT